MTILVSGGEGEKEKSSLFYTRLKKKNKRFAFERFFGGVAPESLEGEVSRGPKDSRMQTSRLRDMVK